MNKFKKTILLFLFLIIKVHSVAFQPEEEKSLVKWLSLKEAMEKNQVQPKPILFDFYTSWCGWCKVMMKTTYSDSTLALYINNFFYPVKFDAEGKDTVEFLGKKYGPTSLEPKAPHELAMKLLQGKLMYPTTIFMNGYEKEKNEFLLNMTAAGYLDRKKIEPLLVFTVENVFRNCAYEDFRDKFDETYYDSTLAARNVKVKWFTPKEVFTNSSPRKKKTLVFIHSDWCNACKVMQATTFSDSVIYNYMNEKFDLVDFNAENSDSLNFKGNLFINPHTQQMPFNQLSVALCRNNFVLPSLVFLDENLDLTDVIPYYIPPKLLKDILHFYGDEINKKKSWQDYMADPQKYNSVH